MKLTKTLFLGALAVLSMACTQTPSTASADGLNIGYLRLDSLTQIYTYHQTLVDQFEIAAQKIQAELVRGQENLQSEYDILSKAAPRLSKLELERAQQDFQRIQGQYSNLEQQRSGELQQLESTMNNKVKVQVDKAVKVIQAERGMDLILVYESNVLYGAEALDLTQAIADILNNMDLESDEE